MDNKSLRGKTVVNFGDSIFGNFRPPEDISTYIAEETGATVYNVGFGGCRMSEHSLKHFDRFGMYRLAYSVTTRDFTLQDESFSYEPIEEPLPAYFKGSLELLKSIDFSKVDIITIAYATNDYTAERPVETENRYDLTSFAGALRYSLDTLIKAFPNVKIVLCTPLYRFWRDERGEFTDDSETRLYNGQSLKDFIDKMKEIAKDYGLHCIDNYRDSGINAESRSYCFSATDSSHPLEPGRRMVAKNMARELIGWFG